MRAPTAAVLAFVVLATSAAVPPRAAEDGARAQAEAADAAWMSAFNAKDARGLAALYAEDALLLADGAEAAKGRDAIQAYWEETLAAGVEKVVFEAIDARRAGDVVHVAGRWEASVPGGGGGAAAQTISGNNLRVLEPAAGGGWATRVHIYNTHGE